MPGARWWWLVPLSMAVATRALTLVLAWVATKVVPGASLGDVLTNWDGNWYQLVAAEGYVELTPGGPVVTHPFMTLAFLPLLPMSTRLVDAVTGVGISVSGVALAASSGVVGSVLIWRLIERRLGGEVATMSLALLLLSPHGFVLSMLYTEGPMLLLVAGTFWALRARRWELAGLCALVAGLARPNGFVLVVPCLVEALAAGREAGERRSWRPLVAPILAPAGFLAWMGYAWYRTGQPFGYFEVQRIGWGASIDAGRSSVGGVLDLVTLQWGTPDEVLSALFLLLGLGGVLAAWRARLDASWRWYALALVVLTFMNERQASTARFLLPAFPLFVGWAVVLGQRRTAMAVGVSGALMGALFLVSSTTLLYTP